MGFREVPVPVTIQEIIEKIETLEKVVGLPSVHVANQILGTSVGNVIEWLKEFEGNFKFGGEVSFGAVNTSELTVTVAPRFRVTGLLLPNLAAQGIVLLVGEGAWTELNCAKATTIEGIKKEIGLEFAAGTEIKLTNAGSFNMEFLNNLANGGFLFSTGANIILEPKHSLTLIYSGAKKRWIDMALR